MTEDPATIEAEGNTTPLIDVVFLLIIFFLCIDFRVLEAKLPAYLPKDRGSAPRAAEPVEQLPVRVICSEWGVPILRNPVATNGAVRLEGHRIRWQVGASDAADTAALERILAAAIADRQQWQTDSSGTLLPPPVVIEPGVSTTYGDVAATVDAVRAAGFGEIHFAGGSRAR